MEKLKNLPRSEICSAVPKCYETLVVYGEEQSWLVTEGRGDEGDEIKYIMFSPEYLIKRLPEKTVLTGDGTFKASSEVKWWNIFFLIMTLDYFFGQRIWDNQRDGHSSFRLPNTQP